MVKSTTLLAIVLLVSSCTVYAPQTDGFGVIPCPLRAERTEGTYFLHEGWQSEIVKKTGNNMLAESYRIKVTPNRITITAADKNGFLYAGQTLEQLIDNGQIPACRIYDKPRFGYRGMHFDCARHFFTVDEIKSYLDILATYKLNHFHWHLTDEQGWRFESNSYPELNRTGSWRNGTMIGKDLESNDGIRYGGYYTREEMTEIIEYASQKGITVIPEINSPGHTLAALASYPEIGCTGGPYAVRTKWYHTNYALCPGKETTFDFISSILAETCEVFPGKYIHVGGDECGTEFWEKCPDCQKRIIDEGIMADSVFTAEQKLLGYYAEREQNILAAYNRKMIAWQEMLVGNLKPGSMIMAWQPESYIEAAKTAAAKGVDVIMVPGSHLYFDMYQTLDHDIEPLAYGGFTPLEKVYSFEPLEGLTEAEATHVAGVQACLWSEYCPTIELAQYKLLPRLPALSEVQWCETKDYKRFITSLRNVHLKLFHDKGWNYCPKEFTNN